MTDLMPAVVVLKTFVLVLGGLITYYAGKAYRRTGSAALRSLFVGFGFVTLGALGAGLADQILHLQTAVALVIESAVTTVGLFIIVVSLYQQQ